MHANEIARRQRRIRSLTRKRDEPGNRPSRIAVLNALIDLERAILATAGQK
jgi:hypothetical protein